MTSIEVEQTDSFVKRKAVLLHAVFVFVVHRINLFDMKCILAITVAIVTMNDYICCYFYDSILVEDVDCSQSCTSMCKSVGHVYVTNKKTKKCN